MSRTSGVISTGSISTKRTRWTLRSGGGSGHCRIAIDVILIKNISRKQLTDWGRMRSHCAKLLVRQVQRRVSPYTLAAPEPAKPIGTTDQIQSMIDRAFAPKTSAS